MTIFPERLHISKSEINELPMECYKGPIHLCRTPEEADIATAELAKSTVLGFDTETRPAFRKGESYLPSLLQLAGDDAVYLFQITTTGLTEGIISLLSDPKIIKAGVAIDRDISELQELTWFQEDGFVELADFAKLASIRNLGLRGLTAVLFGFRISKREQVSNWARTDLSDSQITYAATDAWLGRKIFNHFDELGIG